MSPAMMAAVAIVAVRLGEPLVLAGSLTAVFELSQSALERIEEVLAVEPLPVPAQPLTISGADVRFDGVTFTYRGQTRPALASITFDMAEGSLTALVGPSGSGKSTIAKALMRYADPIEGSILIGGTDIRHVEQSELMRHISAVFQDVYLFDGTIAENVRMARPSATDAEVEDVLRAANCDDFVERLPHGIDTRVGEIGGMLSGGERQRVAIARALLKDAPIVILDEPTSALDSDSEVAVQQAIDVLVRDRTVLVIAHRLSTVAKADQILVLDEGRIVESGHHEHLIEHGERYRAMWLAQQSAKRWRIHA
jgi:ATP-binding cassette, subfamily B, bacterial IrtB/YbtQ